MATKAKDYLPAGDDKLLAWTANFDRLINLNFAAYGLSEHVATAYTPQQADFATKLAAATNPDTRGKRTVFLKNESKDILVAATRGIVKQITGMLTVTDAQRQELGITVPSGSRTPVPAPKTSPFIQVTKTLGRVASVELRQDVNRRGRPRQVAGATIVAYFGETPSANPLDWSFVVNTSKTTVDIDFGPSATGDTVFISAFWTNAKSESGPAATPVQLNLPAGTAAATAKKSDRPMRAAA